MDTRITTKVVHNELDKFIGNDSIDVNIDNRKVMKRSDGLIERIDISKKMFIAEDNRQLLND